MLASLLAGIALTLLAAGGAWAAADPPALQMPKQDRDIYNAVSRTAKLPAIGPISLRRGDSERLEARFSVRYPDIVRRGVQARVRGAVHLLAFRKRAANGVLVGRLQQANRVARLPRRGGEVSYAIELSPRASAWLSKRKKPERARLVEVEAELLVDVDRDGRPDHNRSAAATVRYSHQRAGASASDANNSIFLILVNATGGPIYNVSMPVMCMYEGEYGSSLRGFNYEPMGYLPAGATHASIVAANSSIFDSPDFQSNPQGIEELIDTLRVTSDVVQEVTENIPLLATVEDVAALLDSCAGNASFFMFTAAEAGKGGNASTTGGWVMSEDGNYSNFLSPIDSAVAATAQQVGELGSAGIWPKWGYSPFYDEPGHYFNPTSQALYPAAFRWSTYENPNTVCYTERGDVVWSKSALIGDHGLSWRLAPVGGKAWELQVYRTGFEEGWSGANPANRQQTGNTGSPPWLQMHPRSLCPGW